MKKKIMMCFLLLVLLSVAVGCAVKPYSKFLERPYNSSEKIIASNDGNGYFIIGHDAKQDSITGKLKRTSFIAKCNEKGNAEWAKHFYLGRIYNVNTTKDNGLMFVISEKNHIRLAKINEKGKVLWVNEIRARKGKTNNLVDYPYGGNALIVSPTDEVALIVPTTLEPHLIFLLFINENGQVIQKNLWLSGPLSINEVYFFSDKSCMIVGKLKIRDSYSSIPYIHKFDSKGNLVTQRKLKLGYSMTRLSTGDFLITSKERLTKLDSSENIIWQKKYNWTFEGNAIATQDGGWLIATYHYPDSKYNQAYVAISKYDKHGKVEWTKGVNRKDKNNTGTSSITAIANTYSYLLVQNINVNHPKSYLNVFELDRKGKNTCLETVKLNQKKGEICKSSISIEKKSNITKEIPFEYLTSKLDFEFDISLLQNQTNLGLKDTVIHFQNSCGIKKIKSN